MIKVWLALILTIGMVLLAGCGGENGNTTSFTETATGENTTTSATADYSGSWQGTMVYSLVSGICSCPTGATNKPGDVTVSISQKGDTAVMKILSGLQCSPAEACNFNCTVNGNNMTCTNSGAADNEGGRYSNTYGMVFKSEKTASGSGTSAYSIAGADGFECSWNTSMELSRS
ncbi:hypothetical protein BMS3Abin01_00673 [bacterium BMS3Abin01]|nr:hypothetical protein BMS3Abin01_00673 [bacterium BMS3Abin01]